MKKTIITFCALSMAMTMISCGNSNSSNNTTNENAETIKAENQNAITVHNGKEFLEAIKSDAHIIIDCNKPIEVDNIDVNLTESYDYEETGIFKTGDIALRISNINNLTIEGKSKENAIFTSKNPNVDILTFYNCKNLNLKNLTIKHSEHGFVENSRINGLTLICAANTAIDNCNINCNDIAISNDNGVITITNCDIFDNEECGICIGITGNTLIKDSKIHNNYMPFMISGLETATTFEKCDIIDNSDAPYMEGSANFLNCKVEDKISDKENAVIIDCNIVKSE
ncbi:MAG: right-handed parallel beta-helix repeat-containing protein [Bacteroidales bacterium]|nr:right-handed parallel beta-helix repeat-containing protein [Bacteroidales bacterium]